MFRGPVTTSHAYVWFIHPWLMMSPPDAWALRGRRCCGVGCCCCMPLLAAFSRGPASCRFVSCGRCVFWWCGGGCGGSRGLSPLETTGQFKWVLESNASTPLEFPSVCFYGGNWRPPSNQQNEKHLTSVSESGMFSNEVMALGISVGKIALPRAEVVKLS